MNSLTSRAVVASVLVAALIVPIYAHHGTQFLSKVIEMNTAEIRLGEMAASKTQNAQVKEYAQMLVKDHNQALDKARELWNGRMDANAPGKQNNRDNTKDVQLTPAHQQAMSRLQGLSGDAFDREYINMMVRNHREGIRLFEAQSRVHGNANANKQTRKQSDTDSSQTATREKPTDQKYSRSDLSRDVDTAEFARETLPTLKQHLEKAQNIQAGMIKK
jgi:predicted outer membrane protein